MPDFTTILAMIAFAISMIAIWQSSKANKIAKKANKISEASNVLSEASNEIAKESNQISKKALSRTDITHKDAIAPNIFAYLFEGGTGTYTEPVLIIENTSRGTAKVYSVEGINCELLSYELDGKIKPFDLEQGQKEKFKIIVDREYFLKHYKVEFETAGEPQHGDFFLRTFFTVEYEDSEGLKYIVDLAFDMKETESIAYRGTPAVKRLPKE